MNRLTGDRGKHAKDSGSRSVYDLRGKKWPAGHEPAHRRPWKACKEQRIKKHL